MSERGNLMKLRFTGLIALFLFLGCSNYKFLQPKPVLSPEENGYIELKNGKKNFELKKDKKYFVQFPSPQENNFYLVLQLPQKDKFNSFCTTQLIDKKKYGEKIADESASDTQSVYPMQKNEGGYYLLIEQVKEDLVFDIEYRYAPQWRFKFENKHFTFKEILNKNRVDRAAFNAIGSGHHLDGANFAQAIDTVKFHSAELNNVYKELLAIESIFPAGIVNSKDEAYENYKALKKDLEDEMGFQANYLAVLNFFGKEFACRGNPGELIKSVEAFTAFFARKAQLPSPVISEAQTVIKGRLNEVVPFYDQRLTGKSDYKPFEDETYMVTQLYQIGALYESAGLASPAEYSTLAKFVKDFNSMSTALSEGKVTTGENQRSYQKTRQNASR